MSVNPAVIATAAPDALRRGMETLPHALLETPAGLLPFGTDSDFARAGAAADVRTLRSAIAAGAAGIALAGCRTGADIQRLAVLLCVAEAEEDREDGSLMILGLTDGLLPAPGAPQGFAGKSPRLAGLVWDWAALARTLGLSRSRTERGEWTAPFAAARAATVLAAAAAGVPAYDSASDIGEEDFALSCARSRDDGFYGRIATNADQASLIETVYARR